MVLLQLDRKQSPLTAKTSERRSESVATVFDVNQARNRNGSNWRHIRRNFQLRVGLHRWDAVTDIAA
jgi:hypothetical protein